MNLSRVKVWTAEILYASDLNAEFNNIINHEIANADIAANAAIEGAKLKNVDIDLTSKVKGILPTVNGGTGVPDDTYDADKIDGYHAASFLKSGDAAGGDMVGSTFPNLIIANGKVDGATFAQDVKLLLAWQDTDTIGEAEGEAVFLNLNPALVSGQLSTKHGIRIRGYFSLITRSAGQTGQIRLRLGPNGTTGDTELAEFAFSQGSADISVGRFEIVFFNEASDSVQKGHYMAEHTGGDAVTCTPTIGTLGTINTTVDTSGVVYVTLTGQGQSAGNNGADMKVQGVTIEFLRMI